MKRILLHGGAAALEPAEGLVFACLFRFEPASLAELLINPDFAFHAIPEAGPILESGSRLVTNAGGLNPRACALELYRALPPETRVASVTGDDVLPLIADTYGEERKIFTNAETHLPISVVEDRLVAAKAHVGSEGVVEALNRGAAIVITGDIGGASLATGACRHGLGIGPQDYDALAAAAIAGELLRSGLVESIEVFEDGTLVVPKISAASIAEVFRSGLVQRVFPDARAVLDGIGIAPVAGSVRVTGIRGGPPPPVLRVTGVFRDGDGFKLWPCFVETDRVQLAVEFIGT